MATKKQSEALVAASNTAMAAAGDPLDRTGKEDLSAEDMMFPRLAFAQKTSPQIDPENKSDYIPGLQMYQMFNSLTKDVYGNEVTFAIIRRSKRAIEFDAEGNVVDFNVPLDDPRCEFTEAANGQRIKPVATKFYDYLVAVFNEDGTFTPCMLSLKTTQIKTAKQLNSLIAARPGAIYASLWKGRTTGKKSGAYTFTNFTVAPAGRVPDDLLPTFAEMYQATEGKLLDTERDNLPESDVSSDDKTPF